MIKYKVAIVRGASSGIGYATALALSRSGAKVAAGARRMDRLELLQNEISKNGEEVFIQKLDVTVKSECDAFADAILKKWDTIDILINNPGLQPLSLFKNLKVEDWDKMIDVNIRGVFYCTAAVIPPMMNKNSGHIVNISSMAGRVVYSSGSVYWLQNMLLQPLAKVLDKSSARGLTYELHALSQESWLRNLWKP
jgi:NADP-dependent 3-hydroxy acid dehydrogenase YdfG